MHFNTIWFLLIAVLYIGFFFLEGFDFGVGMLLPFLGKNDTERRTIINTIGPHWDGNEVWLLTAGGATFAAFPHWYATMFSGFYAAFFLLLLALILRGVAFEFRSKDENPKWRSLWDWAIFFGSLLPSLLLGVAFANLVQGVPINADMTYTGTFWTLLNPFGLLGGLLTIAAFILHGAVFLSLKTSGELTERARTTARKVWFQVVVLGFLVLISSNFTTNIQARLGVYKGLIPIFAIVAILLAGFFIRRKMEGWAFAMTGLAITLTLVTEFMILFPRVMVSSLNPKWSLTIYNASSSPYTLKVMTIVGLIFIPIVLIYQGWSYWIFRKRITNDPKTLTY
jgi:cytochrome d ubiquinol oxidase subunit II